MGFVALLCGREYSPFKNLQWVYLEILCSGCASIAILDLKQSEAQKAAEELAEFAGTFHNLIIFP